MIVRVETDVVAIAQYAYGDLNLAKLWITFDKAREH